MIFIIFETIRHYKLFIILIILFVILIIVSIIQIVFELKITNNYLFVKKSLSFVYPIKILSILFRSKFVESCINIVIPYSYHSFKLVFFENFLNFKVLGLICWMVQTILEITHKDARVRVFV